MSCCCYGHKNDNSSTIIGQLCVTVIVASSVRVITLHQNVTAGNCAEPPKLWSWCERTSGAQYHYNTSLGVQLFMFKRVFLALSLSFKSNLLPFETLRTRNRF